MTILNRHSYPPGSLICAESLRKEDMQRLAAGLGTHPWCALPFCKGNVAAEALDS